MRHRKDHRKLSCTHQHRRALLRNPVTALFQYERIETTLARRREARRLAERMITFGKQGDVAARRHVSTFIFKPEIVGKLFDTIAPRVHGAERRLHAHHQARPPSRRRGRDLLPRAREVGRAEGAGASGAYRRGGGEGPRVGDGEAGQEVEGRGRRGDRRGGRGEAEAHPKPKKEKVGAGSGGGAAKPRRGPRKTGG